jgi:hypothetical protein
MRCGTNFLSYEPGEGVDLKREVLVVRGDTGVAKGAAGHDVGFSGAEPWCYTASSPP